MLNRKQFFQLVTLCLCFAQAGQAQAAVSLPGAIQTAFQKNEKTQANKLQLEAAFEQVRGLKLSTLGPSVRIGHNQTQDSNQGMGTDLVNRSQSRSTYASISINLFSGFVDTYRIQSAQCRYQHQEAVYNSTDTQIQHTKGQIAGLVAFSFLSVVSTRQAIDFNLKRTAYLERMLPYAANKEQTARIQNSLDSLKIESAQLLSSLTINENDYEDVVNEPAPSQMDSLDATISKISIPKDHEEAFAIALEKSPDVLSARLGLKCQEIDLKRTRAENRGLSIDLSASASKGRTNIPGQPSMGGNTKSIGIYLSKSFDLGMGSREKSESLSIQSAQKAMDSQVAATRKNLINDYIKLQSSVSSVQEYTNSFHSIEAQIEDAIALMEKQKQGDVVFILDLANSYEGRWWQMNESKKSIINLKFSIQRRIGTLFDQVTKFNLIN